MTSPDPNLVRRKIATVHSDRAAELATNPNPALARGRHRPEVIALSELTSHELTARHNRGDGLALALLCESADEKGWS